MVLMSFFKWGGIKYAASQKIKRPYPGQVLINQK